MCSYCFTVRKSGFKQKQLFYPEADNCHFPEKKKEKEKNYQLTVYCSCLSKLKGIMFFTFTIRLTISDFIDSNCFLTFTTLWTYLADVELILFFLFHQKKKDLTVHANVSGDNLHAMSKPIF